MKKVILFLKKSETNGFKPTTTFFLSKQQIFF